MMKHGHLSPLLYCLVQALEKAARPVLRDFGEVERLQVRQKGPSDFVSQSDLTAEKILIESLRRARPQFSVISEEQGVIRGDPQAPTFIIDPIDGTSNFIHGVPHFCLAVAVRVEQSIQAAAIFDPVRQELFSAETGRGAWLNGRRIKVSGRTSLSDALLAVGISSKTFRENPEHYRRFMTAMIEAQAMSAGVRRTGSSSLDLAYVAAGRFDAYWQAKTELWDLAPGALIVKEAGGFVGDFQGKAHDFTEATSVFASQPNLRQRLYAWLKRNYLGDQVKSGS